MDYSEGSLDNKAALNVKQHLDSCPECSAYYRFFMQSLEQLKKEAETTYDPYMYTRIMEKLRQNIGNEKYPIKIKVLQPVMLMLVIVFMVLIGIGIGRNYSFQNAMANDYMNELYYLNGANSTTPESVIFANYEQQ